MLDFLGIGAQKAGTTWLYTQLARHPQIRFPAGKEVYFWDAQYHRGVGWYRALFPDAEGVKQGEITPAYAILPPERIGEIRRLNPSLRILYLIRNPIERAWSSALMALGRAEMTLEEASDRWFIDHFRSAGSLARGDYARCLSHWYRVFPAGQILVVRYEAIGGDPRSVLQKCCNHIGVDAAFYDSLDDRALGERVFAGPGHAIRPSLRPLLLDLYRPRIERLAEMTGEDFSGWLR